MKLKDARRQFLALGYSVSEYSEVVSTFGKQANVLMGTDSVVVQQPGYGRFIVYESKRLLRASSLQCLRIKPPSNAEFLFYLLMASQNCDVFVGDLEERYKLIYKTFGKGKADFWYWSQTTTSLAPIVWAWAKKVAMKPVVAIVTWSAAKGLVSHDSWLAAVVDLYRRLRS